MSKKKYLFLLLVFFLILIWSAINPHDYFTWSLEVLPTIIGCFILIFTYSKYQFTDLIYFLILLHAIILIIGGHYTYAEVPFGNWIKESFNLTRNHYDRLGHLMQGFVPALILREIILRKKIINGTKWQFFFIIATCLAISAFYELIEWWWIAVTTGTLSDSFFK